MSETLITDELLAEWENLDKGRVHDFVENTLFERLNDLELELNTLARWKREQLEVESSWDPQAVGKLIGLPIGYPIRSSILGAIEDLQANVAALEEETRCWQAAATRAVHAMQMENWHWGSSSSNDMKREALTGLTALLSKQEGGAL